MELKGRLELIYSLIPECDILCDVGTDHALIPAYALLNNRCKKAIACDVKPGPLERAQRTLIKYGLQERMELRLGSGLEPINEGEADVIIMAGMGGVLITELIKEQMEKAKKAKRLILQPMYAQEVVRPFLRENGFKIADEALVREGGKLYQVIAVVPGPEQHCQHSLIYGVIGEGLVKKRDPLIKDWISDRIKRQKKIVNGLKSALKPRESLEKEEELLKQMIVLLEQIKTDI